MTKKFSRRLFMAATASLLGQAAVATPPIISLRPLARGTDHFKKAAEGGEAIISAAKLDGQVGYSVFNAETGLRLEGYNSQMGLPPASVAKAITALYALDTLGSSYRFTTRLFATGGVSEGVILGDLILVGGGDPTFNTDALSGLAKALKSAGIREVRGAFKVDESALPYIQTIDQSQPDHVGYSPAISGIALNFNRVHFEWRRADKGYGVTMDARSKRVRPEVSMAKMQVVKRSLPIYTYTDAEGLDHWTVARSALGNSGARWLPVRKPALYAGDVFQTLARSQGIILKEPKVISRAPIGKLIASHQSDELSIILKGMLRYSTNITAEMVGMSATLKRIGNVQNLESSASEMNRWAEVTMGLQDIRLVDHSGLSGRSRMNSDDMVIALIKVDTKETLRPILKPVAMRDNKGRPIKAHPIKVDAKTGTLNFVSGLAGYITAHDGTVMAFAIFAADNETRSQLAKTNREAPQGARPWNRRAKTMQQKLIKRWSLIYGT
ncbi:MAG: D-alanyl-D-alanine carboxypeptidase/D-alanyl-D-alanine-endopeptidase [Tateyamaria sp.]|nr:D-alanyl-D-alanine carboxypeptidase/D-alanyl-D-alanine-endopeptidase [Tateyamaria sp.]